MNDPFAILDEGKEAFVYKTGDDPFASLDAGSDPFSYLDEEKEDQKGYWGKFFERTKGMGKVALGGLGQAAVEREQTLMGLPGFEAGPKMVDLLPDGVRTKYEGLKRDVAQPFKELSASGRRQIEENAAGIARPEDWRDDMEQSFRYYGTQALDSAPTTGAALAITALTKNPTLGLSVFGSTAFGQVYDESRREGKDATRSFLDASVKAGLEVATEKLPLDEALAFGRNFLRRVVRTTSAEVATEMVNETGSILYDFLADGEKISFPEFMQSMKDTALTAAFLAGPMATAGHALAPSKDPNAPKPTGSEAADRGAKSFDKMMAEEKASLGGPGVDSVIPGRVDVESAIPGEPAGTGIPEVSSGTFLNPFEFRKQQEEARIRGSKAGLTEDQMSTLVAELEPADERDATFDGYFRREDRDDVMDRLAEHIKANPDLKAFYIEGDIVNLGGLNKKAGTSGADKHLKVVGKIALDAYENFGIDIVPVRRGGDELAWMTIGADQKTVVAAMQKAESDIAAYASKHGLNKIPHTKEGKAAGFGLLSGISEITAGRPIGDIYTEADTIVEARKDNVNESKTEETGVGAPDRQAERTGSGAAQETTGGQAVTGSEVQQEDDRLNNTAFREQAYDLFYRDSSPGGGMGLAVRPGSLSERENRTTPQTWDSEDVIRIPSDNPAWVKAILSSEGVGRPYVLAAAKKLREGEKKLGVKEARVLGAIADEADARGFFNEDRAQERFEQKQSLPMTDDEAENLAGEYDDAREDAEWTQYELDSSSSMESAPQPARARPPVTDPAEAARLTGEQIRRDEARAEAPVESGEEQQEGAEGFELGEQQIAPPEQQEPEPATQEDMDAADVGGLFDSGQQADIEEQAGRTVQPVEQDRLDEDGPKKTNWMEPTGEKHDGLWVATGTAELTKGKFGLVDKSGTLETNWHETLAEAKKYLAEKKKTIAAGEKRKKDRAALIAKAKKDPVGLSDQEVTDLANGVDVTKSQAGHLFKELTGGTLADGHRLYRRLPNRHITSSGTEVLDSRAFISGVLKTESQESQGEESEARPVETDLLKVSNDSQALFRKTSVTDLREIAKANAIKSTGGKAGLARRVAAAAEKAQSKDETTEKIEDFGEEIGGARKHMAALNKAFEELDGMSDEDIFKMPLSKLFPDPNYIKLIEEEGLSVKDAALIKAMRSLVPSSKPRRHGWKAWVDKVRMVAGLANKVITGEITHDQIIEKMSDPVGDQADQAIQRIYPNRNQFKNLKTQIEDRVKLDLAMGFPNSPKSLHQWFIERVAWNYSDGKPLPKGEEIVKFYPKKRTKSRGGLMGNGFDSWEAAVEALKMNLETGKTRGKVKLDVWREAGILHVGKKVAARKFITLKTGFSKPSEAFAYIAENQEALEAQLAEKKKIAPHRKESNDPRIGGDYRNGEDATAETFSNTFGFRGVQFGNYVEQKKRQTDLNQAYDALMDLSHLINVPPKALSLNGELGLAFGARGKGGKNAAAAHYEPDMVVINLTKRGGAGSLAHEWFHSLDNYFSRMRGKSGSFATDRPRPLRNTDGTEDDKVRPEVLEALKGVIEAIDSTNLKTRSKTLDGRRTKDYWSTTIEMAARTFENYVISKAEEKEMSNDYLANVVGESAVEDVSEYPYLTSDEIQIVSDAYDNLFQVIESRETDKGVQLYSKGQSDQAKSSESAVRAAIIAEFGERAFKRFKTSTGTHEDPSVRGVTHADGRIELIPEHIPKGEELGIFMHEGVHSVVAVKLRENGTWGKTAESLHNLKAKGDKAVQQAYEAIPDDTATKHVDEEALAYLIQQNPKMGIVKRFIAAVRKVLSHLGIKTAWMNENADDLRAMVISSLKRHGGDQVGAVSDNAGLAETVTAAVAKVKSLEEKAQAEFENGGRDENGDYDFDEYMKLTDQVDAAKQDVIAMLDGQPFQIPHGDRGWRVIVTPSVAPDGAEHDYAWRTTDVDKDGPASHQEHSSYESAAKSALFDNGDIDLDQLDFDGAYSKAPETYYSAMLRHVRDKLPGKGTGASFAQQIQAAIRKGQIKQEEVDWSGVNEFLAETEGKISRDEVVDFIQQNRVQVEEVVLGEGDYAVYDGEDNQYFASKEEAEDYAREQGINITEDTVFRATDRSGGYGAKFADWQTPGGKSYRELLLTLPVEKHVDQWFIAYKDGPTMGDSYDSPREVRDAIDELFPERNDLEVRQGTGDRSTRPDAYTGGHFDQPNVLAHIRFNERTDADGKRVLFVEEVQSDWHQAGRKEGYQEPVKQQPLLTELPDDVKISVGYRMQGRSIISGVNEREYDAVYDEFQRLGLDTETLERTENGRRLLALDDDVAGAFLVDKTLPEKEVFDEWLILVREHVPEAFQRDPFVGPGKQKGYRAVQGGRRIVWTENEEDIREMALRRLNERIQDANQKPPAGVPNAPFKKTWPLLAMKRMIRYASEQGFDRLAWTTGEMQADRYDLSKQVDAIGYKKRGDLYDITVGKQGEVLLSNESADDAWLEANLGKDVTKKIIGGEGEVNHAVGYTELTGVDLKVGGEGMKAFYDKMLPSAVNKYVKKWGAKVGRTEVTTDTELALPITPVPSVDITASMKESVMAGQPLFSKQKDFTPEETAALGKIGLAPDNRGFGQKVKDSMTANWQPDWKERFVQGTFDRFARIKRIQDMIGVFAPEQDAYIAARLSNGAASVMRAVMMHGAPKWKDGIVTVKPGSKGLMEVLEPVKDDMTRWLGWMVGHRAVRLRAEGRENNLSDDDIKALLALAPKGKTQVFKTASNNYQALNDGVLDLAVEAGLIDKDQREMWRHGDYIPFYREGSLTAGKGNLGLAGQKSGIFKLKGGEAALKDPLTNILANMSRLIDSSLKNHALTTTIDNLETVSGLLEPVKQLPSAHAINREQIKKALLDTGVAQQVIDAMPKEAFEGMQTFFNRKPPTDPDVIRVMRDGKAEYYRVNDELLLRSLTGINMEPIEASAPFRPFKRLLTAGITSMPDFMARNFTRDALHAWVITEGDFKPGWDSARGLYRTMTETGGMVDMQMAGASFMGGYLNAGDPDSMAKVVRETLREKGFVPKDINQFVETLMHPGSAIWAKWRRVGDNIENANREAVYESILKETGSTAAAVFGARDLMDFGLQGDWKMIRFFADVLPFFNARLQGLYKLDRAGAVPFHKMRGKVMARGGMITMASLALLAMNWDDEEYEALEDWDKDTYWHIAPGTAMHVRIPKPFEIGVIFGTIPERLARFGFDRDDGGEATKAMLRTVASTFAINPIPQAVRPAAELVSNKNFFTGRPIEGFADANKLPSARYNEHTSPTLRLLGEAVSDSTGVSPKQMEHLVKGYTGTAGMYVLGIADMATRFANDMPVRPTRTIRDVPVIGSFFRGNSAAYSSKYQTELYDILKEGEQTFRTMNAMRKEGRIQEANELAREQKKPLRVRKALSRAAKQLSTLRKQMDIIYRDEKMTAATKRKKIDALLERRNKVAKDVVLWADEILDAE